LVILFNSKIRFDIINSFSIIGILVVMIIVNKNEIMKTYLLLLFLSALFLSNLNAQSVHLGIKGGANINKLSGQSFTDKFTFGYHYGAFVEVGIGNKFTIQPEVFFSQVEQDTSSQFRVIYNSLMGNATSKVQLNYINIPVLLGYKASDNLTIQVGPQYSILMSKNETLLQNGKNAFKSGDFSLLAGLQLQASKFRVYGRYAIGLSNLNDIDKMDSWKSQSIQIGIGLAIF